MLFTHLKQHTMTLFDALHKTYHHHVLNIFSNTHHKHAGIYSAVLGVQYQNRNKLAKRHDDKLSESCYLSIPSSERIVKGNCLNKLKCATSEVLNRNQLDYAPFIMRDIRAKKDVNKRVNYERVD